MIKVRMRNISNSPRDLGGKVFQIGETKEVTISERLKESMVQIGLFDIAPDKKTQKKIKSV